MRTGTLIARLRALAAHPAAPWTALALAVLVTVAAQLRVSRATMPLTDEVGWAVVNEGPTSGMLELWGGWFDPLARLTFNLVYGLAGLDAGLSFRLLAVACNLVLAGAVTAYCLRRGRPWTAVALVLFLGLLGPAVHTLLFPINALNALGMAGLPAALVLLERGDRRGDIAATVVLLVTMGFAGPVAVPVCLGVLVWLALQRPFRGPRLAVAGAPLAVYLLAYATLPEGGYQATGPFWQNVRDTPAYALDSAAGMLASLAAMGPPADGEGTVPTMGAGLLVLAVVAIAVAWRRLDSAARARVVALAATATAAWVMVGISRAHNDAPVTSRYIILGALPALLIAVEVTGVAGRAWRLGALGVLGVAMASNALLLSEYAAGIREQARMVRAEFGALELVMERVAPLPAAPGSIALAFAPPGLWAPAVERHGPSFAVPPDELVGRPADERAAADRVLWDLGAVTLAPTAAPPTDGSCTVLEAGGETPLPPEGAVVTPLGPDPLPLNLRRFADGADPARAVAVPAGSAQAVDTLEDAAPVAWTLVIAGPARVCAPSPPG